jgi:U3 small nucleolar RNA-associated protein 15
MPDFKKLKLKQFPLTQERETSEARYWKSYGITGEEQLVGGAASSIHFNPLNSSSFLVTYSTKVAIYDTVTDKSLRAYTRFADQAYSGRFRKDGKLLVAGDKSGCIKVFDIQTKAMLREMRGHSAAVHSVSWSADGLHMTSGSDDHRVKRWDLGTQEVVWESKGHSHSDYVRAVDCSPVNSHAFVSCGYDHVVKVWDSRQPNPVYTMDQGQPVEACVIASSGSLLISAGGNEVKVWDLMSSGRLLHTFCNHQKNISSLALDVGSGRVLSTGLDGLLKVYSLQTLQVTHGMRFGSPLSCVGLSPNGKKLVVGFMDGNLMIRTKSTSQVLNNSTDLGNSPIAAAPAVDVTDDDGVGRKRRYSLAESVDGISGETSQAPENSVRNKFYKGAGLCYLGSNRLSAVIILWFVVL